MKITQDDLFYTIQLLLVVAATYYVITLQYNPEVTIAAIYGALITMKLVGIESTLNRRIK